MTIRINIYQSAGRTMYAVECDEHGVIVDPVLKFTTAAHRRSRHEDEEHVITIDAKDLRTGDVYIDPISEAGWTVTAVSTNGWSTRMKCEGGTYEFLASGQVTVIR